MTRSALAASLAAAVLAAGCGEDRPAAPTQTGPQATDAPAFEEVVRPDGRPRGVMLIFPAGGWFAQPREAVRTTEHYTRRYARLGWTAVNVGYRPGGEEGYRDALDAYERARRDNPGLPICAVGESSGGHLALMLAVERPLACVEAVGAPADLPTLKGVVRRLAVKAFGARRLERWSPARAADRIRGRVMLVHAGDDLAVLPAQARAMKRAKPDAELIVLPRGDLAFMHETKVDEAAYGRYLEAEDRMLRAVAARGKPKP